MLLGVEHWVCGAPVMGDQDWLGFRSWLHSIVVVTFDLELGQVIENVYPTPSQGFVHSDCLSEHDRTNVCYLAFPDSNSGIMGDIQFHFRIRRSGPRGPLSQAHKDYNNQCLPSLQLDHNFLFGYAYFRQVKDPSIRRGYYQKSVILLSYLPLVEFFTQVTTLVARKFFESGELPVEVACHDIDRWDRPIPGHHLTLPLLGTLVELHLPSNTSRAGETCQETVTVSSSGPLCPLPAIETGSLFSVLLPLLDSVHTLWELALTAEPLVVQAPSPAQCSATVQALTSLIHPLRFMADYRPFYTIHDADFKELTSSNSSAIPAIILGVTNPFFNKALQHWPNLIRLVDPVPSSKSPAKAKTKAAQSKFKSETRPGVFTASKPLLERDKEIVKKITKGLQLKRPAEVQTALLRRYFLELTQTFMIPLERYLASLMPLARTISPFRAPPKVRPFSCDDLIRSLESSGPQLTSRTKGDWAGLYRRFLKSPNFVGWYNQRHHEVSAKLSLLHLESLAEAKIGLWMAGKAEVELVDMVLRIRGKLAEAKREELPLPDIVVERLEGHVKTIVQTLPQDLQGVIMGGGAG